MMFRFMIILSLMITALLATTPFKQMKKELRVALVIANSEYDDAPLSHAVSEASQMRDFLEDSGFSVMYLENVDKRQMIRALRKFSLAIEPKSVALFYYNGHAVQFKQNNHLIPIENGITDPTHIPYATIKLSSVVEKMQQGRSRLNIVIVDAGHPDPFGTIFKPEKIGYVRQEAIKGFDFFFSLLPGRTSKHRRFTPALIKAIKREGTSNKQAAQYLHDHAPKFTTPMTIINNKQSFYFKLPKHLSTQVAKEEKIKEAKIKTEKDKADKAWLWAKKRGTLAAYSLFVKVYPKSQHSSVAHLRIKKLKPPSP